MSFVLTGVQHLKSGDVVIPALGYERKDDYMQKYHHEMDYAYSNPDFLGLGILVFDKGTLQVVLSDNWIREIEAETISAEPDEPEVENEIEEE